MVKIKQKYERKWEYWHQILEVSPEYQAKYPDLKVGLCITHDYIKHNEGVCMIDLSIPKEYPSAYVIDYIGRVSTKLSKEERWKEVKRLNDIYNANKGWSK